MAILKQSSIFPTSFVVTRDVDDIVGQIKTAAGIPQMPGGSLNVFFLGEAHNNDFDIARRREVFEQLKNDNRIVLAVERTLVSQDDATNVVVEMNDLKSVDDGRNRQIVGMVQEKFSSAANACVVVFFYGQEHEPHICKHMLKELAPTLGLNWVTCLPIDVALKNRLSHFPSLFSTKGKRPVGYCENNGNNYLLKLLEKGYVLEPFNIDLYAAAQVGSLFSKTIYAIYFKDDTYAKHQRKPVEQEGSSVVNIKRISGAYTVVAKILTKDQVGPAEAGNFVD